MAKIVLIFVASLALSTLVTSDKWEARKSNTKNNTPILITSNLKSNM